MCLGNLNLMFFRTKAYSSVIFINIKIAMRKLVQKFERFE